jgi:polysaccharide biosynthesis transport protein
MDHSRQPEGTGLNHRELPGWSQDPPNSLPAKVELVSPPPRASAYRSSYVPGARYGGEEDDGPESDSGLLGYWRMLLRHRAAILISAVIGILIGFGVGIPMKPVFRARTSIEILNLNEDFMNMKRTNPVTTTDNSYDTSEEQTQGKLLESDALMERVIRKLDPGSQVLKRSKMATSGWRSWLHLREPVQMTQREKLLKGLVHSLKVRATARTRVIEATAESTDPQLAADFANTLTEEFIQQSLESRFAATHRTSDWLTREIDDARVNLKKSEDALQAYARSSGLIFTDENTNVATERLQQVQRDLSNATSDRIAKQARFELARNSPPDTVADVLNDAGLKDINGKLGDLRRRVADLSAVFNPEYSQLKRAQAELAVTESSFERTRADILKRIENDYQEAISKEKLLAAAYDDQTREVSGQDEKAIQYNILKREVDSGRQLYDTMLQQTKESSIASALHASNIRVVDPAELPAQPVSPDFRLNSAIGLFAGLFLSIAVVTIRERADRTLQQPGDISTWADLTELGSIPSLGTRRIYGRASVTQSDSAALKDGPATASRSRKHPVELITWEQKPSLIAEGFRSALTSILFVGDNGTRPRVLVFTSAHPSDGKTTVVTNLAIATAEIRRKVLVIDADLRRPRMHDIFSVPNDRGLSDILREELSEENVAGLIQQTAIPNLHVLPAGKPTYAAAHLLYSRNFAPLLAKFKNEYDMIFVDTPPMLQITDARVAGRLADGVVLVVRAGDTTRDAILAAKNRLEGDCIRILGAVLNDWNPKKSPGGYYGKYENSAYDKYKVKAADA